MCNDSETHLVMLLNQLCSRLQDNPALLEVFFKPDDNENKFIIFSILLRFLHFEGKGKLFSKVLLTFCGDFDHICIFPPKTRH